MSHPTTSDTAPADADGSARAWLRAWETVKRLPAPLAFALGRAGGAVWYRADRRRRDALRANLRQVVGPDVGERDLERLVRRAFAGYGRYWIEAFRLELLSAEQLLDQVTFVGLDHLDAAVASGRGVVIATVHVGNWDAGGAWLGAAGYPALAVAEQLKPVALYERFKLYRERLGLKIIPLASGPQTMRGILAALRRGEVVLLVADRDLTGHGVEVEFFGRRTTLPSGPATLALRTGAVLLPGIVYQEPEPGRWRPTITGPVEIEPTGDLRADVETLTSKLATALESLIAVTPEQWYVLSPIWRNRPSDRGESATYDGSSGDGSSGGGLSGHGGPADGRGPSDRDPSSERGASSGGGLPDHDRSGGRNWSSDRGGFVDRERSSAAGAAVDGRNQGQPGPDGRREPA